MNRQCVITFDRLAEVAYIQLTDAEVKHTREMRVLVDLDENQTVRGIEFLELAPDVSFPPPTSDDSEYKLMPFKTIDDPDDLVW
jgi:uncharacterized protein YuzE